MINGYLSSVAPDVFPLSVPNQLNLEALLAHQIQYNSVIIDYSTIVPTQISSLPSGSTGWRSMKL